MIPLLVSLNGLSTAVEQPQILSYSFRSQHATGVTLLLMTTSLMSSQSGHKRLPPTIPKESYCRHGSAMRAVNTLILQFSFQAAEMVAFLGEILSKSSVKVGLLNLTCAVQTVG